MRNWSFTLFCIVLSVLLILTACVVSLFAVGFRLAAPYQQTRHFAQEATLCSLEDIEMEGSVICDCGGDDDQCYSEYPCAKLHVNYLDTSSGEMVVNATLYHSAYEYTTLKDVDCFARKCKASDKLNKIAVLELVLEVGKVKDQFLCHPGPRSNSEVLLEVIPQWKVLLGMLLPATPLVIAAILALTYCCVSCN